MKLKKHWGRDWVNKIFLKIFLEIKKSTTFAPPNFDVRSFFGNAGIAQLVEHDLAKVGVAGPSPVSRSKSRFR